MDTPHAYVWHDERGRRITSIRWHAYRFPDPDGDGPDDAADRDGVDIDAETDGGPATDAGSADATDPDTGVGVVGL